jgi:hypothetical protein
MTSFVDARLPIRFGHLASLRPDEAVLLPEGEPGSVPDGHAVQRFARGAGDAAHPAACPCCVPRGPLAAALTSLFLARARGEVPFFTAVLVAGGDERAEAAIREALRRDPLVGGRYRAGLPAASS